MGRCGRNSALGFGLHGPLVYTWIKLLEGPLAETLAGLGVDSASWGILVLKIFLDQTIFSALLNILYASLNGVLSDLSPRQAFARALQVLPGAMVAWLGLGLGLARPPSGYLVRLRVRVRVRVWAWAWVRVRVS